MACMTHRHQAVGEVCEYAVTQLLCCFHRVVHQTNGLSLVKLGELHMR